MSVGESLYDEAQRELADEPQPSAPPSLVDQLLADMDSDLSTRDIVPVSPSDAFADDLNTR